jgi:phosphomannomutase
MITINVANDFAREPGARTFDDGKLSGQEFYEKLLRPKYLEAVAQDTSLQIILDGAEGYASSFLNEAFRRLGQEFGPDIVLPRLVIVSNEVPKFIKKIHASLYEKTQ